MKYKHYPDLVKQRSLYSHVGVVIVDDWAALCERYNTIPINRIGFNRSS